MVKKEIEIQGLKLSYLVEGKGIPLLLLHGWGGSSNSLRPLGKFLARENFLVYLLDLPGFGHSQPPKRIWGTDDFAKVIWDFCQKLNLKKISLFGHSFGGRVAVQVAVHHKELVRVLVLCAPSGLLRRKSFKISFFWLLAKLGQLLFTLPPLCFFQETARKILYLLAGERDYLKSRGVLKKIFQKVNKEDLQPLLSKIKVKTLLVWGREDKMVSPANAPIFRKEIKSSFLNLISGSHDLPKKKPQQVAKIITKFIEDNWKF